MTTPDKSVEEIAKSLGGKIEYIVSNRDEYPDTEQELEKVITQTLQNERQKREEVVEALEAISRMCDGNNPHHEAIWHTAYGVLEALTQPNNQK